MMPDTFRSNLVACALALFATSAMAQLPEPAAQVPTAAPLDRADLEAWLDGLVPYALQQGDIAGLEVSVVKDGEVLLEKAYGYADVVRKIPADPGRTVMRAASVSKTFTATAVMQLAEQGKLDLDRDVNAYLDFEIPPKFGKPITLRNLLTHTPGFEEISYRKYDPRLTLRQHLLMIPERIYPPGQIPAYSNYGLDLAGYIVQRASGERISEYVEKHILTPLDMSHSTFHLVLPAALQPFEAKTYSIASSGVPYDWSDVLQMVPVDSPSGGLATTAHDMTRFMLAHLQQGRFGDRQLLRPETLQLMHSPAFVAIPGAQPVALGLFRADYKGHRVLGHSGDGEGAHAEMKLLPDENVGIFTAVNSDGVTHGIFPAAFMLRATLFEQFVDRYFPVPVAAQEPTVSTAQEHAQLAAGEYAWSRQQQGDYQEALALIIRFIAIKPYVRANADGTIETPTFLSFEKSGADADLARGRALRVARGRRRCTPLHDGAGRAGAFLLDRPGHLILDQSEGALPAVGRAECAAAGNGHCCAAPDCAAVAGRCHRAPLPWAKAAARGSRSPCLALDALVRSAGHALHGGLADRAGG